MIEAPDIGKNGYRKHEGKADTNTQMRIVVIIVRVFLHQYFAPIPYSVIYDIALISKAINKKTSSLSLLSFSTLATSRHPCANSGQKARRTLRCA